MWLLLACTGNSVFVRDKDTADTAPSVGDDDDSAADDDDDTDPGDDDDDDDSDPPGFAHTIVIDGSTAEWSAEETLDGGGTGTFRFTWDDDNLYVAMTHPDVATGTAEHWLLVYLGNGTGSTTGVQHGSQQPILPTPFSHLVRTKLDDSYDSLMSGSTWSEISGFLDGPGARAESGDTLELAIPRSSVGVSTSLTLHANLLFEGAGFESSYAPAPSTSFTEGAVDPDYTAWFEVDLTATPSDIVVR